MKATSAIAAWSILFAATPSLAQNYPEQTVRILVGFSAGTAPDVSGRLLAERLSNAWNKAVVVENITGAGGNIAADRVAKAPPNGYALGMIGNSSLVFSPSLYDKLSFDPLKDFAPISRVFVAANVLAVPWFGLMAPAGTPPAIIERLHRETLKVLAQAEVRKKLNDLGLDVIPGTPAEFTQAIEREIPRWAAVIKQAGIKATE